MRRTRPHCVITQEENTRTTSSSLLRRFGVDRWSPLPLRLMVGYGFMEHGFAKLTRGPEAFASILQANGVPAARLD
jgi:uncharacterized membrane protein YphA (DoxX/SURF4 family)